MKSWPVCGVFFLSVSFPRSPIQLCAIPSARYSLWMCVHDCDKFITDMYSQLFLAIIFCTVSRSSIDLADEFVSEAHSEQCRLFILYCSGTAQWHTSVIYFYLSSFDYEFGFYSFFFYWHLFIVVVGVYLFSEFVNVFFSVFLLCFSSASTPYCVIEW